MRKQPVKGTMLQHLKRETQISQRRFSDNKTLNWKCNG
uniref:Uncharacterized protein n=1 Tax=Rhizophora mucronata TaxID=61149 RepID=A0A2P2NWU9_RHIMU